MSNQSVRYLGVLYLQTGGVQGALLGSDEQEINLLIYTIFDVFENKVIGVRQYHIRPRGLPHQQHHLQTDGSTEDEEEDENQIENGHSPPYIDSSSSTGPIVDDKTDTDHQLLPYLEEALTDFDIYLNGTNITLTDFRLVTDGQCPIRQCLHPEAWRKDFELPEYYNSFYDIRKEYQRFSGSDEECPQSIGEILELLQIKAETDSKIDLDEFSRQEAKDMVEIVQRLTQQGHRFELVEIVQLVLEPGILSKDDPIDPDCVVRARGLPWQSSDQDIAKFFRGLNVAKGGVALCLSALGRRNGEALVRFQSAEHRALALHRHKHHLGSRYIEVYRAGADDFRGVAGGASEAALAFLGRGAAAIVRMRGLPYDCTAQQVLDFFANGDNPCRVRDGSDGVLFVKKPDGRATGDAFVLFSEDSDAQKAISKHRQVIGTRYIELFRSTTAEVQQVLNRSMEQQAPPPPNIPTAATTALPSPLPPTMPLPGYHLLPQHMITSGTRKDCVRLRGLPYEAQVEHILDFLGDHAKNIVYQGVHMVYNAHGQPSGEAFIQMDSEQSAYLAAHQKHHRYMGAFGKKQRYIEVFQCSGEDMNIVLTGGLPSAASPPKPQSVVPGATQPSAAAAHALLTQAASMLPLPNPSIAQLPPPHHHHHHLHPPPSISAALNQPAALWEPALLHAQQQAQLIAQQNLLARQTQNEMLLLAHHHHQQQHNLAFMSSSPLSPGGAKPPLHHHPLMSHHFSPASPFVMFPPPGARLNPHLTGGGGGGRGGGGGNFLLMPPQTQAFKRSYGDAFQDVVTGQVVGAGGSQASSGAGAAKRAAASPPAGAGGTPHSGAAMLKFGPPTPQPIGPSHAQFLPAPIFYWPLYPSPPVSPTAPTLGNGTYYIQHPHQLAPPQLLAQQMHPIPPAAALASPPSSTDDNLSLESSSQPISC